jgi:thiol-disulfide isomerase/thioredoxin
MRLARTALTAIVIASALGIVWRPAARAAGREQPDRLQSEQWPQPAPKLIGTPDDWLNTNGKALKLEKGRVYLIDFWEYTCVNCLRTLPYLKEWQQRYAKDGLVIIGIHTPEFQFAKDRSNVAAAVKKLGITWPVLVDSEYQNWTAYGNSFWPRKYFIDAQGRIIADHAGEGAYAQSEALIQRLLKQLHPRKQFPKAMAPIRDTDKPGAVCYPVTPELYAGGRGYQTGQHGNISAFDPGQTFTFTDPGAPHDDGKIYAHGVWRTETESLRHGRATTDLRDYIALRYHALECNAVIKPEGGASFRVEIWQDGKPIRKEDSGTDIRYDENGHSYILVEEPRMYNLTRNAKFGHHELRLASDSPDFGLYSFTFSSCEVKSASKHAPGWLLARQRGGEPEAWDAQQPQP